MADEALPTFDLTPEPAAAPDASLPTFDVGHDDVRPSYISGLDHNTAINESPLDLAQRLQLSAGQVGGSMTGTVKTLQGWGYEVKKNKQDDLVIKDPKDNLWKQYDAKDAWSSSRSIMGNLKEMGKDVADMIPGAIAGVVQGVVTGAIGAAAAAEAIGTGGLAAVPALATAAFGMAAGAAAGAAVMTTMGKLARTYQPDPGEEFKDLATETVLNFGGSMIAAGVKPLAGVIGRQLQKAGPALSKLDNATKEIFTNFYGGATGIGSAMEAVVNDEKGLIGTTLASEFKSLSKDEIKNEAKKIQVVNLKAVAPKAWDIIKAAGRIEGKAVIDAADADLKMNGSEVMHAGLETLSPYLNFNYAHPDGTIRRLSSQDLVKQGISGVEIAVKTGKELAEAGGQTLTPDSEAAIKSLVNTFVSYDGVKSEGKNAAKWMMNTRQSLIQNIKTVQGKMMTNQNTELAPLLERLRPAVDAAVGGKLNLATGGIKNAVTGQVEGGQFSKFLQAYGDTKAKLSPYTALTKRAANAAEEMAPYESYLQSFNTQAGSKAYRKGAGDVMTGLSEKYLPSATEEISKRLSNIDHYGVIGKVADWTKGEGRSLGLGAMGYMLGNPLLAAGTAVASGIAQSPRLAVIATPTMLKMARVAKSLIGAGGEKFARASRTDPRILQQLLTEPYRSGIQEEQINQQVGGMLQQAVQAPTAMSQGVNFQNPAKLQAEQMKQQQGK